MANYMDAIQNVTSTTSMSDAHNQTTDAQIAQIQQNTQNATASLRSMLGDSGAAYSGIGNQANLAAQQQQDSLRARLATVGQTPDQSLTLSNNADMTLRSTLGKVNKQQQRLIDDTNKRIQQLEAQGESEAAQALYANTAEKITSMNADKWLQEQYDLEDKQRKADYYYNLFINGKMTASQFEKQYKALTGTNINVKAYAKRRSTKSGGIDDELGSASSVALYSNPDILY